MPSLFHHFAGALKSTLNLSLKKTLAEIDSTPNRVSFMQAQRRTRLVLRAMWSREFDLAQNDVRVTDPTDHQPYIEGELIYLPSEFSDLVIHGRVLASGHERYQAAAAHAAAHIHFTREPLSPRSLDKLQLAVIAAIEDARVESLAIRRLPGLKRLWARQHTATPAQDRTAGDYIARLARALLDEHYQDDHPWIANARAAFAAAPDLEDPAFSRSLGLQLAEGLRALRVRQKFHPGMEHVPYRDDNRRLWNLRRKVLEVKNPYRTARVLSRHGTSSEAGTTPAHASRLHEEQTGEATFFYPEWNYHSKKLDLEWVTLRETETDAGDPQLVDRILEDNRQLVARTRRLLLAMRDMAVRRIRGLEEGDVLDLNAAVRSYTDMRMGRQLDQRIMMRLAHKNRDVSVLLLLDLSRSMGNVVQGQEHSALDLSRELGVLLADAISAARDPFAIHGFSSTNRFNVEYLRMKDFGQPLDDTVKARLAGMTPRAGTRMGAALRHATHQLAMEKSHRKLLIVLSDGEPQDSDMFDPKYLHMDAKMAVDEAAQKGVHTFCISFDPAADFYVNRIFGAGNFMIVDHVRHLPEKVMMLYAALVR